MAEVRASHRVAEDFGEEAPLRALEPLLFLQRPACLGCELLFGHQIGLAAKLLDAQEAGARCGELVVGAQSLHQRAALRSGRLRRDTWSVSHFTERRARSVTTATGSCV